jgi:hypothetical protein
MKINVHKFQFEPRLNKIAAEVPESSRAQEKHEQTGNETAGQDKTKQTE